MGRTMVFSCARPTTQIPDKVTRDALRRLSDQLDQAPEVMPDEADEADE